MEKIITEEMLDALRVSLGEGMSPKRYKHTVEVERMAVRLGEIYLPEKLPELRAAALLHDITKEYNTERHLAICEKISIDIPREELLAPKTFHARTAAALIPTEYPELATDDVVSAVRWHTTGNGNMTLFEKLIYLADYIDMSRSFEDCVALRNYFFDFDFEGANEEQKLAHLRETLIKSYDYTIRGLLDDGKHINDTTFEARNFLILER